MSRYERRAPLTRHDAYVLVVPAEPLQAMDPVAPELVAALHRDILEVAVEVSIRAGPRLGGRGREQVGPGLEAFTNTAFEITEHFGLVGHRWLPITRLNAARGASRNVVLRVVLAVLKLALGVPLDFATVGVVPLLLVRVLGILPVALVPLALVLLLLVFERVNPLGAYFKP